jgi:UDP-2,3-diacylglucosamine hydrolase
VTPKSHTLFVSDLHLAAARPEMVSAFIHFLDHAARAAERLYVLGDCFDIWLGDDDARPPHPAVTAAFRRLTGAGTPVKIMRGNHDFLLGERFAAASGCELLADSEVIDLYGRPTLIMHGDALCTDDVEYQRFRAHSRDPDNQRRFLAQGLEERAAQAERLRSQSRARTRLKPEEIMDVSREAVLAAMRTARVRDLIHGHTHRPGVHSLDIDGSPGRRIVLADWYESDSVLVCTPEEARLARIAELGPPTDA